jgi:hypothetical protein
VTPQTTRPASPGGAVTSPAALRVSSLNHRCGVFVDRHDADIVDEVTWLRDQAAARPASPLRPAADDSELPGAVPGAGQSYLAAYERLISDVQAGRKAQADIAAYAPLPYGAVLLRRAAHVIPAADLRPGLRAAGQDAAAQALRDGACAADLSSLHLLALLSRDDQLRIRSRLPAITIAWPVVTDLIATRDHLRSLFVATHTTVLNLDGTITDIPVDSMEHALLRDLATAPSSPATARGSRRQRACSPSSPRSPARRSHLSHTSC